jgi:hypothetical protein
LGGTERERDQVSDARGRKNAERKKKGTKTKNTRGRCEDGSGGSAATTGIILIDGIIDHIHCLVVLGLEI